MQSQLKPKEYKIMCIMLDENRPMTASEIVSRDPSFTVNIVQAILRKLLKMNLVEVADIVYSRNVLSRTFQPTAETPEILAGMFSIEYKQFRKFVTKESLFSAMLKCDSELGCEPEDLQKLESILKDFKEQQK